MSRYMHKIFGFILCFLFASGCARAVFAEEGEGLFSKLGITASGAVDFYSKYIWRGFTLDRDPVVQPSFNMSYKGLTFSFWSNWDADNEDGVNSDEVDFIVDYTKSFDKFSVSVGHTYYDFPGTNGYSREFYVGVGTATIPFTQLPVSTSLKFYRDYGSTENGGGNGNYLELALAYSTVVIKDPGISLDLGVTTGYNHHLFINGDGGQSTLSAGFTVPLTKSLSLKPKVNYTIPFADLSASDDGAQKSRFWGGFSLAYTF